MVILDQSKINCLFKKFNVLILHISIKNHGFIEENYLICKHCSKKCDLFVVLVHFDISFTFLRYFRFLKQHNKTNDNVVKKSKIFY